MNKLDDLKEKWGQQTFNTNYSKEELNRILQQKSSHSIRWIFYLSLLEFVLYLALPILLPNYAAAFQYYKSLHLYSFSILTTLLGYAVLIYFMWRFYQNYRQIKVSSSVSTHLQTILKTRRTVNVYFFTNLGIVLVFTVVVLMEAMKYDENFIALQNQPQGIIGLIVAVVVVLCIIIGFFALLYYLVYGRFLRTLKKNEEELKA